MHACVRACVCVCVCVCTGFCLTLPWNQDYGHCAQSVQSLTLAAAHAHQVNSWQHPPWGPASTSSWHRGKGIQNLFLSTCLNFSPVRTHGSWERAKTLRVTGNIYRILFTASLQLKVAHIYDLIHHWLNGHEFEQASGVGEGQGSLVSCSPWGCKASDMTRRLNCTYINDYVYAQCWSGPDLSSFSFLTMVSFFKSPKHNIFYIPFRKELGLILQIFGLVPLLKFLSDFLTHWLLGECTLNSIVQQWGSGAD